MKLSSGGEKQPGKIKGTAPKLCSIEIPMETDGKVLACSKGKTGGKYWEVNPSDVLRVLHLQVTVKQISFSSFFCEGGIFMYCFSAFSSESNS